MATHSSILAWRIPWTEEPGEFHGQRSLAGYSPWVAKSQTRLKSFHSFTVDRPRSCHTKQSKSERERHDPA